MADLPWQPPPSFDAGKATQILLQPKPNVYVSYAAALEQGAAADQQHLPLCPPKISQQKSRTPRNRSRFNSSSRSSTFRKSANRTHIRPVSAQPRKQQSFQRFQGQQHPPREPRQPVPTDNGRKAEANLDRRVFAEKSLSNVETVQRLIPQKQSMPHTSSKPGVHVPLSPPTNLKPAVCHCPIHQIQNQLQYASH